MNTQPRNSILAACLAPALSILLAGCFFEQPLTNWDVYFNNTTDEDLIIVYQDDPDQREVARLPAHTRTTADIVKEGKCTALLVIQDLDGNIVKDPGEVCGQDTITIP